MTSRCNLYDKLSLMRKLHYIVKVKGFCRCGWSFMSVDFELAKRETVIGGPNWMSWKPLKVRDFLAGIVEGNIHIWKAHGEPCGRELGVTSRIILMPPASDASEHQPSSHRNINPANKPNELGSGFFHRTASRWDCHPAGTHVSYVQISNPQNLWNKCVWI